MQFLPVLVVAMVAATATTDPLARSESVLVDAVIDGDTIAVARVGRVRLLGIAAPRANRGFEHTAPFGRQARERLASLVLHHWVRLEQEAPAGRSRRRGAYVLREDGVFVNEVLVREGLARVRAGPPLTRLAVLQKAEREARAFVAAYGVTRPAGRLAASRGGGRK